MYEKGDLVTLAPDPKDFNEEYRILASKWVFRVVDVINSEEYRLACYKPLNYGDIEKISEAGDIYYIREIIGKYVEGRELV